VPRLTPEYKLRTTASPAPGSGSSTARISPSPGALIVARAAQGLGAALQQQEQALAADAAEAVAGRQRLRALEMDGDVVPIGEMRADCRRADRVIGGKIGEGFVGKHHAPAEGVVGPVTLDNNNIRRRIAQLHADGEIQAGRPSTEAGDLHRPSFSFRCGKMAPSAYNFKHEISSLKLIQDSR
jgi:hypothetical protein